MLETVADVVVTFGSLALAILGVIVSIIPNLARRRERWLFVAAFLMIGAMVSTANYLQLRSSNSMQQEVWKAATGGRNYPYFNLVKATVGAEPQLVIVNPGRVPLYDVRASILELEDKDGEHQFPPKILDISRDIVTPGVHNVDLMLDGRTYLINIKARNGEFHESLDISHNPFKVRRRLARIKWNEGRVDPSDVEVIEPR